MPKSLGQIHTTKFNYELGLGTPRGKSNAFLCDNSAALSKQFNRNIRMMQSFKWVGADLVVQLPELAVIGDDSTEVVVKGRMRYFAPTKGRCQALRDAYMQLRKQAQLQGVDLSKNRQFDFRVLPRPLDQYPANTTTGVPTQPVNEYPILNTTTLNGTEELCMVEGTSDVSVFETYNSGVRPNETNVAFSSGLQTQAQSGFVQTDFVINEGLIQGGNPNLADVEFEDIPFELAFNSEAERVYTLQWRPDPALYVSVLGGFIEIIIDEANATGASVGNFQGFEIDIAMHWAGWKSIVRPPKKNRKFSSRSMRREMRNQAKILGRAASTGLSAAQKLAKVRKMLK